MKTNPRTKQLNAWRKRRELAQALHADGLSFAEIARKLGCSKQRVHQIVNFQRARA